MRPQIALVPVVLCLLGATGKVAVADQAEDEAIARDRGKSERIWRVMSLRINEVTVPSEDAEKITVTNYQDGTWVLAIDGEEIGRATSKIDPTRKPRTIDLTMPVDDNEGKAFPGIYELDGEYRKLCYSPLDRDRPTEFSSRAGSARTLVVFKRLHK
jgi:uncharacterized protein (TIGR03067 family)